MFGCQLLLLLVKSKRFIYKAFFPEVRNICLCTFILNCKGMLSATDPACNLGCPPTGPRYFSKLTNWLSWGK